MHPAKHAHLAPNCKLPYITNSTYFQRSLACSLAVPLEFEPTGKTIPSPFPLSPTPQALRCGGCGFIPKALLMACRQIYEEARVLPWETNEFVFINWFCSGVYAARAFLRALQPWQQTGMRWARIEVLGRDLKDTWVTTMVGGRAGGGEWKDLCGLWAGDANGEGGLRGLRLGIKGLVTAVSMEVDGSVAPGPAHIDEEDYQRQLKGALDVDAEWITEGLGRMKSLWRLELEIEDESVRRDDKVSFCLELERKLYDMMGGEKKVNVVFVEVVREEAKTGKREPEVREPGDTVIFN
jgi:hypothetical protein